MSRPDPFAKLEDFITLAEHVGPLIIETWTCPTCGVCCYEVHRFAEVLSCAKCGHRHASSVPLYRMAMEEAADNGGSGNQT